MNEVTLSVSDFVALINQTLEYAYSPVIIVGELAGFKISKNKWVYFDLKDELASVRFFGTVYSLPGPLEDGMLVEVRGVPRLHPQFGFSVTIQSMRPIGKGSIKKAAKLLEAKLRGEGLFDESRKRSLLFPPQTVGLITSKESAAFADFMKILNARWHGISVRFIDVQVQGEASLKQIVSAIEQMNQLGEHPDVLVLIRGGGSSDDLQVFNSEQVTRAVAASRIPTLVAIGHEIDSSLAELAADKRASTPSNAAEVLVPDRKEVRRALQYQKTVLTSRIDSMIAETKAIHQAAKDLAYQAITSKVELSKERIARQKQLVTALSPSTVLGRGYAIVRDEDGILVRAGRQLKRDEVINVQLIDAIAFTRIDHVEMKE